MYNIIIDVTIRLILAAAIIVGGFVVAASTSGFLMNLMLKGMLSPKSVATPKTLPVASGNELFERNRVA